jgi:glycosyltransferase involved in cell wall biosynthesis
MTMISFQDGQQQRYTISGVIVARNEADKIAHALASVRPIVQEIIFYDMDSNDGTGAIAAEFGAEVVHIPPMIGQEPVRPRAVEQAKGDWILMFDADEVLSGELQEALVRIAVNDVADVVSLPRFNYLFGKPVHGALMGANDDRQIRFFKKGACEVSPLLHLQPTVQPGSRVLELTYPQDGAILHFNYVDVTNYLTKFTRYTEMEAAKPVAAETYTLGRTILKAGWEFVNRYFLKKGYCDGWRGLYISLAMSFYRMTIWARVQERLEVGTREDIQAIYNKEAVHALKASHLCRESNLYDRR